MEPSPELVTKGGQPAHRRIFEGLREQIVSGRYKPGTQLPGTRELAANWQTSIFTVHTALRSLAKEGWIDRRPNAGTYIADPGRRFLCAGIYHAIDFGAPTSTAFSRYLHFSLLERLQAKGKTVEVFHDPRPEEQQRCVFEPLAEAILHKRVQCLIAPSINGNDAAPLAKLALPSAFLCNPYSKHTVDYDTTQFFRGSAQRLAAQGCRSVGLISNTLPVDHEYDAYRHFFTNFSQAIEREGLVTRAEWIRHPTTPSTDLAGIGYREFKEIWRQAERPDALIVTPDTVAQGAIISILETGGEIVLPRMKFLFHRNAHLPFLCPFPATWGVTNEDLLADALIDLIDKQFAGIRVEPGYLDYTFDHGVSLAAQI